jgi:hypothetical protein
MIVLLERCGQSRAVVGASVRLALMLTLNL